MIAQAPPFRVYMPRTLRRAGFAGDFATVVVAHEGVTIKGADAGSRLVPWQHVALVRAGFTETKHGQIYEARVWIDGEAAPLSLFPYERSDRPLYGAAMRTLAREMQALGRLSRVQSGVSKFEAILAPALIGAVVIAALAAAVFAMEPPAWWHFVVIPGIPAIIFAILVWRARTLHWPRPLQQLSDLERQLPR